MNLQMYIEPPTEDITLVEFEEMALHRLKVLKKIEELRERFVKTPEQLPAALSRVIFCIVF